MIVLGRTNLNLNISIEKKKKKLFKLLTFLAFDTRQCFKILENVKKFSCFVANYISESNAREFRFPINLFL